MDKKEIKLRVENGVVRSAELKIGACSCLVLNLSFDMQGGGWRSFGDISIGHRREPYVSSRTHEATNYAAYYISSVLRCCGVEDFKDLVGRPVRIIIDVAEDRTIGIQHFTNNDEWFIPAIHWDNKIDLTLLNIRDYNDKAEDVIEIDGIHFEASRFISGYVKSTKACEECCFGHHCYQGAPYGQFKYCKKVRCYYRDFDTGNRNVWSVTPDDREKGL